MSLHVLPITRGNRPGTRAVVVGALLGVVTTASALVAAAGRLDLSFGAGGVVTTDFARNEDIAYALAAEPRGRLVAAGVTHTPRGNDMAVVRYLPDGRLDATFGVRGKLAIDVGSHDDQAFAADVSPGGRIVIAGYTDAGDFTGFDFAIAVLTRNGKLDRSFGSDGIVRTDFASATEGAGQVKFLPDARILVAGHRVSGPAQIREFVLARYNADGTLDTSFGAGGWIATDLPVGQIAIYLNGDVVASGGRMGSDGYQIVLARFTREGILDDEFGDAGTARLRTLYYVADFGPIALTREGNIVLGGFVAVAETELELATARITRSGEYDSSYGISGIARQRLPFDGFMAPTAVAAQPDGTIIIAGFTFGGPFAPHTPRFAVARFDKRGRFDATFAGRGVALTTIGSRAELRALLVLPGGDIVAAGFSESAATWWDFALVRYRGK